MKHVKISVILLALLLAAMAIIPIVCAADAQSGMSVPVSEKEFRPVLMLQE